MNKYFNEDEHFDKLSKAKDLHLENAYKTCISEITLQQNKRDDLIKFYITIITLAFTAMSFISSESSKTTIPIETKGFLYLALTIIGVIFSLVITRYRKYKESYWIASKVILQLYHYDETKIDKALIQDLFKGNLKKSYSKFSKCKVKDFFKHFNSAETLMHLTLTLFTGLTFFLGAYDLLSPKLIAPLAIFIAVPLGILLPLLLNVLFFKNLMSIYNYCKIIETDSVKAEKAFNKAFSYAWILHYYC